MRKLGRHTVDRVFEEGLQGAEMPISNKVWAGISSELEKDQLRKKVFWYRSVAAASVLLLFGLSTWMFVFQTNDNREWMAARKVESQVSLPSFANIECIEDTPSWIDNQQFVADNGIRAKVVRTVPTPFKNLTDPKAAALVTSNNTVRNGSQEFAMANTAIPVGVVPAITVASDGIERIRTEIQARIPSLLPTLASQEGRPLPHFPSVNNGAVSELLAAIAPVKKKEREFSFAMDEPEKKAASDSRWEVGAGFSPDMAFASTTPLGQQGARSAQGLADVPTEAKTNRLSPVMAYAAVLRTSYELSDRWSLRAGVSCINRQTSTSAAINTFSKNAITYQSNLNLYTLEVPVSLKYNVIHSKNYDYYVTTGVSGNFFLHYDNYLQTSEGNIAGRRSSSSSEVLKPSQASLLVSTGLRYRLHDRLSLQLEPGLRYGVLRNEYAFSQRRPVSTSLLSGLSYHF
ncbi:MAG TPA: outer membrane beta-barrel protein [Bacteroidia bacterium]|nr:outer membrane beta-barrel protein [Bacteroidia bacterium]